MNQESRKAGREEEDKERRFSTAARRKAPLTENRPNDQAFPDIDLVGRALEASRAALITNQESRKGGKRR